ncbi:MAG: DUF2147 domain-containing protein [Spirochaetia bacterium]|nr:DUF2147 domain-containing protein [Spirochaetia bacterium]
MNRIMKYAGHSMAVAVLVLSSNLFAQATPVGSWKTIDDETGQPKSYVNIWEQNGVIYGTISQLINPSEPDPKCTKCAGDYYNKPVKGMTIMWGLKKDGDSWSGGQILDPNNGKVYTCKIWLEGGNLKLRGYIGPFYRTQTWYRG